MKYIKNGIIFEPHNEFVEAQMKKGGYIPYEKVIETVEEPIIETAEETEEKPKKKKK